MKSIIQLILLVISINCFGSHEATHNFIEKVQNGALVTSRDEVMVLTGRWTIIVTITSPVIKQDTIQRVEELEEVVRDAIKQGKITPRDASILWLSRTQRLKEILTEDQFVSRKKRSLFPWVGSLAHHLFGLVSDHDLKRMQQVILSNYQSTQDIVHKSNELVSHMNRAFELLGENRERITVIGDMVTNITETINLLIQRQSTLANMAYVSKIGQMLDAFESIANQYKFDMVTFHSQLALSQTRRFTENLFPRKFLAQIAKIVPEGYTVIQPLEWYYHNLEITPIFVGEGQISYVTFLPLTDSVTYKLYKIKTFPEPWGEVGHYIQMMVKAETLVADTESGGYCHPSVCIGQNPRVCECGLSFDASHIPCIASLLSNSPDKNCHIKLIWRNETAEDSSIITEVGSENVILSTFGETVRTHCKGRSAVSERIEAGIYLLTAGNCTMAGDTWKYAKVQEFRQEYHIAGRVVRLPQLNIKNILNMSTAIEHLSNVKMPGLEKIKVVPLQKMEPVETPSFFNFGINRILVSICLLLLFVIICTVGVMWLQHKYNIARIIHTCWNHKIKRRQSGEHEDKPIESPAVQGPLPLTDVERQHDDQLQLSPDIKYGV